MEPTLNPDGSRLPVLGVTNVVLFSCGCNHFMISCCGNDRHFHHFIFMSYYGYDVREWIVYQIMIQLLGSRIENPGFDPVLIWFNLSPAHVNAKIQI